MKNENILINYQAEVLELFKSHYKKMVAVESSLQFDDVLNSILLELGITQFSKGDVVFLEDWFKNVHQQIFFNAIFSLTGFSEIIFHSHQSAQVLFQQKKETFEIGGLSSSDFQLSFEIFALKNNVSWNFSEPFASFKATINNLEFRVTLIHHSTSANGKSKIFLRSMQKNNPTLELFKENTEVMDLLSQIMKDKKNILISGGTGSGKTTFLRALLSEVLPSDHVVVLEDTHEIMTFSPNQTSLLAQADMNKKSLKDYCAYALRMSPDRLIVGEMRSTEVVPFMLAMNTGHTGLMSTIHANSSMDALTRIALLFSLYSGNQELDFSLITKLACKNIHYVIHMENLHIKEICRVLGSEGETPFCERIYQKAEAP